MTFDEFVKEAHASRERLAHIVPDKWIAEWVVTQPDLVPDGGTWCEFGVHEGGSLRRLATHAKAKGAKLYGFDSFRGLPEDWRPDRPRGHFAMDRPIMPPEGVGLIVGDFRDTLNDFLPGQRVTFVHNDCDVRTSTLAVLQWLEPLCSPEDPCVVVFDDIGSEPYEHGEMMALWQAGLHFEWLAWQEYHAAIVVR